MFLLGYYSILVFPLLSPARTAFRDLAVLTSTLLCHFHIPMRLSQFDVLYRRPG